VLPLRAARAGLDRPGAHIQRLAFSPVILDSIAHEIIEPTTTGVAMINPSE